MACSKPLDYMWLWKEMDVAAFQRTLGNKTLVTLCITKKIYFSIYSVRVLPCIQDSFLQPTDSASPLHLDPFFLIWSCNKPDPFHMKTFPCFLLLFPMDKCLPMHFRSCWNACPGSGVQQSWSVLGNSSWVLVWLLHFFCESVHFASWAARPDLVTCISAVSCDSFTTSPCSLEKSLWDSRCTDLQVERKMAMNQA